MKKLIFLTMFFVMAFVFTGCVNNDEEAVKPAEEMSGNVPHFYGLAMLDAEYETRGVANGFKVWEEAAAQNLLTVKFMDGTPANITYVKEAAVEWEKYAKVKFHWVDNTENAMIRIKFDNKMNTSWSYTGTDNADVYSKQTEPTMVFAGWNNINPKAKRSDVLRAFGQVLGLELEFRHPDFNVDWLDSTTVKNYWDDELSKYISWEQIENYVIKPLSDCTPWIEKTKKYDTLSVMMWPLYEMIARNLTVLESADQCNTELSELDKEFINELYPLNKATIRDKFLPLVDLSCSGKYCYATLTTTGDLVVKAYETGNPLNMEEITLTIPKGVESYTFTGNDIKFSDTKERTIIIGEMVETGVTESNSLKKIHLSTTISATSYIKNIHIRNINKALEYISIVGGATFTPQVFNFIGFDNLKELYLIKTMASQAVIKDCPNLKYFSTTGAFYKPAGMTLTGFEDVNVVAENQPGSWPSYPEPCYSLKDSESKPGLDIKNCPNLKAILLENTRIKYYEFKHFESYYKLEYIYISTTTDYIVGPYSTIGDRIVGENLTDVMCRLPSRFNLRNNPGNFIVRSIVLNTVPIGGNAYTYAPVRLNDASHWNVFYLGRLWNWTVTLDHGYQIVN